MRIVLWTVLALLLPVTARADDKTCGQMIAERSALPAKMAQLMTAVTHMLDAHAKLMVAGKSKEGKKEAAELKKLSKLHAGLAANFKKTAEAMKKLYAMPGAPHDPAKMAEDPKVGEAMKELITSQKEMIALMQKDLAAMEGHAGGAAPGGAAAGTPGGSAGGASAAGGGKAAAAEESEEETTSEKAGRPKAKSAPSKPGTAPAKPPTMTPPKAPPPPAKPAATFPPKR